MTTAAEALADIKGYAAAGRIEVVPHAKQRMLQRNVRRLDLENALKNAKVCVPASNPENWKVTGPDADGDDLEVVVAIEDGVVVVTVY